MNVSIANLSNCLMYVLYRRNGKQILYIFYGILISHLVNFIYEKRQIDL